MDNLEFHVLFNIPEAIAQAVNEMIYDNEDVVKANMIREHAQNDFKDLFKVLQLAVENTVCQVIDLNPECGILVFFINDDEGVKIQCIKLAIVEKGEKHAEVN